MDFLFILPFFVFIFPYISLQFLAFVEEAVWAVETMKESGLPVAVTMRMGPTGDMTDLSPGEVAVKLARAGRSIF